MIGIMFAALTLMVISRAAVVVAGQAASSVDGEYLNLAERIIVVGFASGSAH